MLDNYIFNNDSIYDILNATVDIDLIERVADSKMEFQDNKSIILYTSLNRTNAELLENKKYTSLIRAFEYREEALGVEQSEYIIKLSYNTNSLYDMIHPKAFREIENIIKRWKRNKSEIEDLEVIRYLLRSHTGVRVHSINPSKKCYTKTHILFEQSKLAYILKPEAINVISIEKIQGH